jgi:hypothetical protein
MITTYPAINCFSLGVTHTVLMLIAQDTWHKLRAPHSSSRKSIEMAVSARKFTPFGIRDILSDRFDSVSKPFYESYCCQDCNELTDVSNGFIRSGENISPVNKGKGLNTF